MWLHTKNGRTEKLNERYHFVIRKLFLENCKPQVLADQMEITVDNLHKIKKRALSQLRKKMIEKKYT